MSRERFIDPGIWKSKQVCSIERDPRQLFVGLITVSDDFGFFTASPHTLRLEIFPDDTDIDDQVVEGWRNQMLDIGLAEMHEVEGKRYLWIPTFEHWQKMKYRAKSRILHAFVQAGSFEVDTDQKGRHTSCRSKSPPLTDYRTNGNISVATENCRSRAVPCRAVPSRAVDGGAAVRAPAPPSDGSGNGKATAGIAHERLNGNGKRQRKLSIPEQKVDGILSRWRKEPNEFRCWDDLTSHAMANADDVHVLGHVLDVDKCAVCIDRKPMVLWSRLNPEPDAQEFVPAEWALLEARQLLNSDMEAIAGEFSVDLGGAAMLKPAAAKKKKGGS